MRRAAWAGVQDSMPRAALLSFHARVEGVASDVLDDPSLAQVWGPRYHVYVVAAQDIAVFTLGRLPERGRIRERALDLAGRLEELLGEEAMRYDDAGVALGVHGNMLRYAALTGRFAIRWEGARRPTIWAVPPPGVDEVAARRELARRYLHVFGPATAAGFARWAGIAAPTAKRTFEELRDELVRAGDGWLLGADEAAMKKPPAPRRRRVSCRAATPTRWASHRRSARCSSPMRPGVRSSGRRASGRARSSWRARSPARGVAPAACSRSRRGSACRAPRATRFSRRPSRCRCRTRGGPSSSGAEPESRTRSVYA